MNNKPVYDFLGYKLLNASFNRFNDNNLQQFSIIITDRYYNEQNQVYSFSIKLKLNFKGNDISSIQFLTAFLINDKTWFELLDNNMRDAMFFSIVFPFIRQKINEFCDDSREQVKLPIINLKDITLDKEVIFNYFNEK